MKKYIIILTLALSVIALMSIKAVDCYGWRQHYQQELTDNPKLAKANAYYKEAIKWIKDGDGVHEPQRAAQFYANAEACLDRSIFALKESGYEYSIDVSKEVKFCEDLRRTVHTTKGVAKRESNIPL